jgi:magnesium transporter
MKSTAEKITSLGTQTVNTLLMPFFKQKTHAVVHPFKQIEKDVKEPNPFHIQIFNYTSDFVYEKELFKAEECFEYRDADSITWMNMEGMYKDEVDKIGEHFGIHYLIKEDIVSYGQRPKFDEVNNIVFVQLNMLFYNSTLHNIEHEQISMVMGKNFVISFQEDARRDVFNPIRQKLQYANTKVRQMPADHLFYSMIDIIVDSYFEVIEKVGERIEKAEEDLVNNHGKRAFSQINLIRKDLILLKRNTTPVRDLVAGILRSDNALLNENTTKYYKDVYDHIMQANDLVDNYRELANTLQEMYFNNMNLRMNEVMKTLAILTSVMAPATVIGGIFGMNFDVIPYAHHKWGFYGTVAVMCLIPLLMIWWFQKRGWFRYNKPEEL